MANEEHKKLAHYLKQVHSVLRKSSSKHGPDKAWFEHCSNKDVLITYAQYMEKLATTHWETNCASDTSAATSRIKWTADFCYEYFINQLYLQSRQKEMEIAKKIDIRIFEEERFSKPVRLIDVGSCYNPFRQYDFFEVLAIDLCPANNTVMQCDFLIVTVGLETIIEGTKVIQIQKSSFDVVAFCFLLEYIPDSKLRIAACEKAYDLIKPGGILIINTPDSKHVGANSKLMKCWRFTLACIGFNRIKYEKFKHMHCMAFRKTLDKNVATRWAKLYKEPYMEYTINIPQDYFNEETEEVETLARIETDVEDLHELPFFPIITE